MLPKSDRKNMTDKKFEVDVENERFMNHLFVRLVAKGRRFTGVDFKYTIFDTCYLRNCVFDSCNFTGCRFIGTSLYGSSFSGCTFDYISFERTIVDNDILDSGCPGHENLKMRFARTLRMNYQQLGDAKSANKAINVELQASGVYLLKAWHSNESYYRKKYAGLNRVMVFFEWAVFKILDLIWGNGESALKLLRATSLVLALMALIDIVVYNSPQSTHLQNSFVASVLRAPQVFLGTISPSYYWSGYLAIVLFIRLVFFAFFMSIIIKRFNRR